MIKLRRTVSRRLTQVAAAGALAAVAGLAGALATGAAASGSSAARNATAATTPTWHMQAPPEPARTIDRAFGDVSCSSSSACLAIAITDLPRNLGFGLFAETWNGSHWTARTVPNGKGDPYLYGVSCRSAQWCVAVGSVNASDDTYAPVADRWNGSAWMQAKPPVPAGATTSQLGAVACSGTTACTAIGQQAKGSGAPRPLAERWNGSSWKIQLVPAPPAGGGELSAVACPTAEACRAVGSDNKGLFSEVWNGSSWKIRPVQVPAGGSFAALTSISCTAADFCEAVGSYDKRDTFLPLAEVWNGSHWLAQAPSTVPGATSTNLDAVSCISTTDCEAAGVARTGADTQVGVLEKWNGTTWSVQKKVLPAGDTSARLSGISCTTGPVCEAVGYHGKTVTSDYLLALRYSS
jgi:hypothetical protein